MVVGVPDNVVGRWPAAVVVEQVVHPVDRGGVSLDLDRGSEIWPRNSHTSVFGRSRWNR